MLFELLYKIQRGIGNMLMKSREKREEENTRLFRMILNTCGLMFKKLQKNFGKQKQKQFILMFHTILIHTT